MSIGIKCFYQNIINVRLQLLIPRLEGSVHGVVVHARKKTSSTILLNFEKLTLCGCQFPSIGGLGGRFKHRHTTRIFYIFISYPADLVHANLILYLQQVNKAECLHFHTTILFYTIRFNNHQSVSIYLFSKVI